MSLELAVDFRGIFTEILINPVVNFPNSGLISLLHIMRFSVIESYIGYLCPLTGLNPHQCIIHEIVFPCYLPELGISAVYNDLLLHGFWRRASGVDLADVLVTARLSDSVRCLCRAV